MPIYSYRCQHCGHAEDILQKLSDPPAVDCPACGQPALKKQVTAAGFQLKGSGWYVTDFKNKSTAQKNESASPQHNETTTPSSAESTPSAKETSTPTTTAASPHPSSTQK